MKLSSIMYFFLPCVFCMHTAQAADAEIELGWIEIQPATPQSSQDLSAHHNNGTDNGYFDSSHPTAITPQQAPTLAQQPEAPAQEPSPASQQDAIATLAALANPDTAEELRKRHQVAVAAAERLRQSTRSNATHVAIGPAQAPAQQHMGQPAPITVNSPPSRNSTQSPPQTCTTSAGDKLRMLWARMSKALDEL